MQKVLKAHDLQYYRLCDLKRHLWRSSCLKSLLKQVIQSRLLRAVSTQVLNILRDGDCTPSLGCPRHEEGADGYDITITSISVAAFLTCGSVESSFPLSQLMLSTTIKVSFHQLHMWPVKCISH